MARKSDASAPVEEPTLFPDGPAGEMRRMFSLPERFRAVTDPSHAMVTLTDSESGREVRIVAGAFGEVRRTLGALFGGAEEEETDFVPEIGRTPVADAEQRIQVPPTRARRGGRPVKASDASLETTTGTGSPDVPATAIEPSESDHDEDKPAEEARAPAQAGSEAPETVHDESILAEAAEVPTSPASARRGRPPKNLRAGAAAIEVPPVTTPKRRGRPPKSASRPPEETRDASAAERAELFNSADGGLPEGWETRIEGQGYSMVYQADAESGEPGYSVLVDEQEVARVRQDLAGKFALHSVDDSFTSTMHKTILGLQSRLDVVLEQ